MPSIPEACTDRGEMPVPVPFKVFHSADILGHLSGSPEDLQRRNWLLGGETTESSFAGVFTRRHIGNLDTQDWRWHDAEEVEFVVQGRMRLQFADEHNRLTDEFEAGPGDLFYIAAGVRHRADAVGDEVCIGVLFCPRPYPLPQGQPAFSDKNPGPPVVAPGGAGL
jgi:mannose-6-phosphate isomerase-like protein (cupin superfamily)